MRDPFGVFQKCAAFMTFSFYRVLYADIIILLKFFLFTTNYYESRLNFFSTPSVFTTHTDFP